MKALVYSTFFILVGAFSAGAGIMNWDFFFNHRRAKFFVNAIGRKGSRIFYTVLGVILITIGILGIFGIIDLSD